MNVDAFLAAADDLAARIERDGLDGISPADLSPALLAELRGWLELCGNAVQLVSRGRGIASRKPESGHTGAISIADHPRRSSRNVMKPLIRRVLTQ